MIENFKKQQIKNHSQFKQASGMVKYAPGAAGMYTQKIAEDLNVSEVEVIAYIQSEID